MKGKMEKERNKKKDKKNEKKGNERTKGDMGATLYLLAEVEI